MQGHVAVTVEIDVVYFTPQQWISSVNSADLCGWVKPPCQFILLGHGQEDWIGVMAPPYHGILLKFLCETQRRPTKSCSSAQSEIPTWNLYYDYELETVKNAERVLRCVGCWLWLLMVGGCVAESASSAHFFLSLFFFCFTKLLSRRRWRMAPRT